MIIYILLEDKNSKLSKRISTKRIITKVTSRDRSRLSRISLHSREESLQFELNPVLLETGIRERRRFRANNDFLEREREKRRISRG